MRRLTTALAVTLLLTAGLVAIAQPAAAAPGGSSPNGARPYNIIDCRDYDADGDVHTFCYEDKGVIQINKTPSGNVEYSAQGQYCYTDSISGTTISRQCEKYHYHDTLTNGQLQVAHGHGAGSYSYNGVTCTMSYNYILANGEVRHERTFYSCV
jgi:hypothetical protein